MLKKQFGLLNTVKPHLNVAIYVVEIVDMALLIICRKYS